MPAKALLEKVSYPAAMANCVFFPTTAEDSPGPPKPTRRSECPVSVHLMPASTRRAAEVSPV